MNKSNDRDVCDEPGEDRGYGQPQLEISLVICTRNRATSLRNTLLSLGEQFFSSTWELIIVDNGSSDATQEEIEKARSYLPICSLIEPVASKSKSLNRALDAALGKVIAFTDDDMCFSPAWLQEINRLARSYPQASIFCGPIIPVFAMPVPRFYFHTRFWSLGFAAFNPRCDEGELMPPLAPFGANTAIRASSLGNVRFREDLGPSERGNFMSEDTEFVRSLQSQGALTAFSPAAKVGHCIRPELLNATNQFERAFAYGRSGIIAGRKLYQRYPDSIMHKPELSRSSARFDLGMSLNIVLGQQYELEMTNTSLQSRARDEILSLTGWDGRPDLLCPSAAGWMEARELLKATARISN